MDKYEHRLLEAKWRKNWEDSEIYRSDLHKAAKPFYNLMMFPYPSAEGLHVGNVFAFVGSDVQGRFHRMNGWDVFEPIGFDAFGMHSENFALKVGKHPAVMVPQNIENFRENQLKRIGNMYDWTHEVDSTSPDYYRWTQWIFLQLYKAGYAYRNTAPVNWCPSCKTVLAAEQVINGECERCVTEVTKKEMAQWFFKTTAYAQKLLDNLEWIDWSEKTKLAQRNWIGRSEGAQVVFALDGHDETFEIFTTRPDTLFGVTYMVFAPEHPLVDRIVTPGQRQAVKDYREQVARMTEIERQAEGAEKTGVFTGAYAINPVNGEKTQIWVSDYVLMGYGTGAIMAVPAHDQRDFEFAQKFGLEIRMVISPDGEIRPLDAAYTGEGVMVNSGAFSGMPSGESVRKVTEWLAEKDLARFQINYRLRDWCLSRQRYWGPPIPIIYCDKCGTLPVPESDLPVKLPDLEDYRPDGSGESPLKRAPEFYHTTCPNCGGQAFRETDVSDNFLCSAWYFYRYPSTNFNDRAFDPELTQKWLPVDLYIGGNEHAVLHLLYSRFLCMAMKDIGLIDFEEPFKKFVAHGMIVREGAKMSKSKGNVINPDDYIKEYGADAFRVYLMFMGDYLEGGDFRDEGVRAMRGFLDRVWANLQPGGLNHGEPKDTETLYWLHRTIKSVTNDIKRFSYNTALARLMELLNHVTKAKVRNQVVFDTFLKLLSPFAPFLSEEMWNRLGHQGSIFTESWPVFIEEHTVRRTVEYVVQVNGKVRAKMEIEADLPQAEIEALVMADPKILKWIDGKQIVKKIFVPGKLVNLVVK
ncbi:MAG: leucine--tRNA ligase [Thermodesulfobacteriota bacterium]|nr:leucine--tRNA ligase [Thermodesulfobacteriota bacterium]